jgi:hypothetical protein
MSFSKKAGSLRDFRIDSLTGETSQNSLPKPPATGSINTGSINAGSIKQSVRTRAQMKSSGSSVSEWEQESMGFDSEQLWRVWEDELQTPTPRRQAPAMSQTIPQTPAAAPRSQSVAVSQPLAPRMKEAQVETVAAPLQEEEFEEEIHSKGPMPWAAILAHTERRMERLGEVEYSNSFKKQEMLKLQTAEFMAVLRQEFARQIEVFNQARQSGAHSVHLYRITNTENDFMLFRNGVKLIVSGQRSGRVLFAFNQFLGQIYTQNQNPTFELEAQWGPFDQLLWTYRNERVQVQDIVRFFTSEFIRQSYK